MEIQTILSFLGIAVLLTLMPGPDIICVLTQSIAKGKKAGMALLLGLSTGLFGHIFAAALGLSAVIYQSALAFSLVKYAGAGYLLFLAYKTFRGGQMDIDLQANMSEPDLMSIYKRGIVSISVALL